MKPCGCKWCNDLRNIEPAKYISIEDKEKGKIIEQLDKEKRFVRITHNEDLTWNLEVMIGCPKCGYIFTEEDYDSYED